MYLSRPLLAVILAAMTTLLLNCSPEAEPPPQAGNSGPPVVTPDPKSPAGGAQVELESQGRFVYERNCLVCHGRWGDGRGEMATGMMPPPGNLTRARFKFRSTPSGTLPTDGDLRRTIALGVAGSSMPAFAHLSDRELTAVIAYLKTFSRRWDDLRYQGSAVHLPETPSWMEEPEERRTHIRRGRDLFLSNCATCHGPQGRGDGPASATLEDEAGRPAPPADFSTGLWKSGRLPVDLLRTLSTGMDGTPMPSFGEALSAEDRWDLVALLLTLPDAPRENAP